MTKKTTSNVSPTPTPWTFEQSMTNGEMDGKALWLVSGEEPNDQSVFLLKKAGHGGLEQARIDAAFIVRAVNLHRTYEAIAQEMQARFNDGIGCDPCDLERWLRNIAKAEGK